MSIWSSIAAKLGASKLGASKLGASKLAEASRRLAIFALCLGTLVFTALAVEVVGLGRDVAAADEAGKLHEQGMAAFNAGKYAEAKRAFDRAFEIGRLHSLGVWTARVRVKLGEWVEADHRYELLLKTPLRGGEAAAEAQAREQAAREREELRHRMPRLRIRLEGLGGEPAEVKVDGVTVADEYIQVKKEGPFPKGKSLEVNPGEHQIVAVSGDQRREASVSVAEGQTKDVSLAFVNPSTIRQRKCRDQCRKDCGTDNSCYVECKRRCFTEGR